jgi:NADH-quinone oxidoreductase subunit A
MQSLFLSEIFNLFLFIIFSFFLSNLLIFLSLSFGYYLPDVEKLAPYECGFDPYEDARNVFDVRFYLIAILFLVFDLEAIFFFPWIINFSFLTIEGFFSMIDFIFELFIGYIYAWKIGALEWN